MIRNPLKTFLLVLGACRADDLRRPPQQQRSPMAEYVIDNTLRALLEEDMQKFRG
jgi:hypothetical protein